MKSTLAPRIIIHGVGNVGCRLIRFCAKKGWPIVAAYNRVGDKINRDIGQLADLGEDYDVKVQPNDRMDLRRHQADIALISTTSDMLDVNFPIYAAYLSNGINVLTHNTQAYNPFFENPAIARQIDVLAKVNNATFTGSGIWDTTRIWSAIIAAGTCVEIKSVSHTAQAEIGRQGSQWESDIGVGLTVEQFNSKYAREPHSLSLYLHIPVMVVLQKLGYTVTDVRKTAKPITFDTPVYSKYSKKEIPAGVVVGAKIIIEVDTIEGIKGGADVEYRLFKEHEVEEIRWDINGMPGLGISVRRDDTANLSASSLFNRIPDVIAAPPGIVEIFRMGPLTSTAMRQPTKNNSGQGAKP